MISIFISFALPIPKIPKLTGPYQVGTTIFHLKHSLRIRKSVLNNEWTPLQKSWYLKIWYPAQHRCSDFKNAPYLINPYDQPFRHRFFPRKSDFTDGYAYYCHLCRNSKVNAKLDVPVLTSLQFPVIIYSHGQDCYPERNTWLAEELSSYGYLVCAVYHDDLSPYSPQPVSRRQIDILCCINVLRTLNGDAPLPPELKELTGNLNLSSFAGRLRLDLGVAIIGHSMGGTTVCEAAASWKKNIFGTEEIDPNDDLKEEKKNPVKITAAVALDPWLEILTRQALISIDVPFPLIAADGWRNYKFDKYRLDTYIQKTKNILYEVKAIQTFHSNMTDFGIYLRTKFARDTLPSKLIPTDGEDLEEVPLMDLGKIDSEKSLRKMIQLIRIFLLKHFVLEPSANSIHSIDFKEVFIIKTHTKAEL